MLNVIILNHLFTLHLCCSMLCNDVASPRSFDPQSEKHAPCEVSLDPLEKERETLNSYVYIHFVYNI